MQPEPERAARVLVVENDLNLRMEYKQILQLAGIRVVAATSVQSAQMMLDPDFSGVVLVNMPAPGIEGLHLLDHVRRLNADLPVIMIAGEGDAPLALDAMRSGAYDFIEKPFASAHLIEVVKRALEKYRMTVELETLRRRLHRGSDVEARLIGTSPQMEAVRRRILDVTEVDGDALVMGEPGAGRDLVARCIHDLGRGDPRNFVALDCRGLSEAALDHELFGEAAVPCAGRQTRRPGKIECANRGTLFLDHVEALPPSIQAKLLDALRDRVIVLSGSNVVVQLCLRVIFGGGGCLRAQVADGRFSSELYHRLGAVTIEVPALRERRQDIPALYDHFLLMAAKRHGTHVPAYSQDEICALLAYDWPGNVSELRNHADCRVLGIAAGAADADANHGQRDALRLSEAVETFERTLIAAELERHAGNISRTSEALGVARTTLHDKMRKYGLNTASG